MEFHPGWINYLAGGAESKVLIGPAESERHPDLSVYLDPEPAVKSVWSQWIPAIVIEVVSDRSSKRDYEEKPDEYLMFGVREYWIVDADRKELLAMTRFRGQWKPKRYKPSE